MAWMEKLMMQVALVDSVTKPLAGINSQINLLGKNTQANWSQMAGGAAAVMSGVMGIQATLQPAIEMDRALGQVSSMGVAKQTLDQLGMTALQFSMDYGKSAADFVRASYDIQSAIAGLQGNELPAFTRASGVLAAATKADTATITSYMGSMYSIFEQQAQKMGRTKWIEDLVGKSATAVQMFKTTGTGMAEAFQAIGANGTKANVSLDEQFAVLGMLQSTMSGGQAGTKFNAFLSGVGNAQKVLGMQFNDSAGQMMPVLDILEKLKKRYGDTMTIAGSDELKKAFGSDEAVSMIKLLMTNTAGLATNINALANTHGMGKAEQMAASMTDQWQRLEAVWFAIRASAFGQLTPAINDVLRHIVDAGSVMFKWTKMFPHLTKAISTVVLAVSGFAALGGVMAILSALGGLFAALAWPVLLVGAAIGALVMWWEPIKAFAQGLMETLWPAISQVFQPWADIMPVIGTGISFIITKIGEFFGATNAATGAFTTMTELGRAAGEILGAVFKVLYAPIWAIGEALKWVLSLFNKLPGVSIDVGGPGMPELPDMTKQNQTVMSPIAAYRQQTPYAAPAGGLGQQLIQANARASAATQKPGKSLQIGEVHLHSDNPMTPEKMAENAWLETQG